MKDLKSGMNYPSGVDKQDELSLTEVASLLFDIAYPKAKGHLLTRQASVKRQWLNNADKVLAKVKQHQQKRLDRPFGTAQGEPELRGKIDTITVKVYGMAKGAMGRDGYDETVVRKATLEYARTEILALFPDIEEMCKDCRNLEFFLSDNKARKIVEEAKKQERERILNSMVIFEEEEAPSFGGDYYSMPIAEWQALKED